MLLMNPFGASTTIRDPEQFFGRAEALDYLYSEIVSRRCVSVVGTRRIGKSSLLRCMCLPQIQEPFQAFYNLEKRLLVFIDLGEFLSKTCDDFFSAVCMQLIIQSRDRLALEMSRDINGGDAFCELLDEIQGQGFHPVLLLDAFDQVTSNTHFDAKFFSFLRAQANHGRVSYVTASIIPLDQYSHPYIKGEPFFNIFSVYRLGPLEEQEAKDLLERLSVSGDHAFTDEEVQTVVHLAGRHPFFIQRVAFYLFRAKYQLRNSYLKLEAYQDLLPHFKNIWESSLNSEQREYLRGEVRWKHSKQKKTLELSESALFRHFIREVCDVHPVDISAEDLENILQTAVGKKENYLSRRKQDPFEPESSGLTPYPLNQNRPQEDFYELEITFHSRDRISPQKNHSFPSMEKNKEPNYPFRKRQNCLELTPKEPTFHSLDQDSSQENDSLPILSKCLAEPYVKKAYDCLTWIERNCLLLYAEEEFTQTDIADILGISKRAVSQHLKRATQLWLQEYNTLLQENLGILSDRVPHSPSLEKDLARVKRLIQGQINKG